MNDGQQLRESMWDLVYGLLTPEESQALIARIKSDPDAARLYAEARLEADLVARAARVDDSSVALTGEQAEKKERSQATEKTSPATPHDTPGSSAFRRASTTRIATWLATTGAIALALLLAFGLLLPRSTNRQIAASFVITDVVAPQPMIAGLTTPVTIRTFAVNARGEPADAAAASCDVQLIDAGGKARLTKLVITDQNGQASLELPGELLEPGTRLEIAEARPQKRKQAAHSEVVQQATRLDVNLPVQPEPEVAYFLTAEPTQASDPEPAYTIWNFGAFTGKPGTQEIPPAENAVAQDLQQTNRAVLGRDANGIASRPLPPPQNNYADPQSPAAPPPAALSPTSLADEIKRDQPAQQNAFDFKQQQTVVAANQPVPVEIPKELEGRQLQVAASNRGVTVASTTINAAAVDEKKSLDSGTQQTPALSKKIVLDVPPEADGLIEVDVYDQSKNQAAPVNKQFVYRQRTRELKIDLPDLKDRYRPGEEVTLTIQCADERGKPASNALLGVRVWNEAAIQKAAEQPVLLADAVSQGVVGPLAESLFESRAELRVEPRSDATHSPTERAAATSAGELSYVGNSPNITVTGVELASNRVAVTSEMQRALREAQKQRQRTSKILGVVVLVGGLAVLVIVAVLALRRLAVDWRLLMPPLAIAFASVLAGFVWINRPGDDPSTNLAQVASRPAAKESVPAADAVLADREDLSPIGDAGALREAIEPTASPRDSASSLATAPPSVSAPSPSSAPQPPPSALSSTAAAPAAAEPQTAVLPAPTRSSPAGRSTALATPEGATPAEAQTQQAAQQLSQSQAVPALVVGAPQSIRQQAQFGQQALSGQQTQSFQQGQTRGGAVSYQRGNDPRSRSIVVANDQRFQFRRLAESSGPAGMPGAAGGFGAGRPAPSAGGQQLEAGAAGAQATTEQVRLRSESAVREKAESFARAAGKPGEAEKDGSEAKKDPGGAEKDADKAESPPALYFNPELTTDAQGKATIQFTMPQADAEYRVLIDALSQGRLGSRQQKIISGSAAPSK